MRPVWDRILVERPKTTQVGSIIIPESSQAKHARAEGVIVEIGGHCDGQWKEGQRILFGRYAGASLDDWIKDGDRELLIIQETDVLAIMEDPDD